MLRRQYKRHSTPFQPASSRQRRSRRRRAGALNQQPCFTKRVANRLSHGFDFIHPRHFASMTDALAEVFERSLLEPHEAINTGR
jgi:hypothetical protein